eukprot:CAMPEP_0115872564 /NCGR_PEP_ID=MMETSP0287-20121206/23495_1 /TAXON_ID=412157 /ORGANISM="Chrysochromulina rotalis, Strain UIO044" /LENGTH=58 /DNA_ID=CAMNT_0003327497 /DNA_START=30 /DNA_END=203 /DNA_ORIENTATION=-
MTKSVQEHVAWPWSLTERRETWRMQLQPPRNLSLTGASTLPPLVERVERSSGASGQLE